MDLSTEKFEPFLLFKIFKKPTLQQENSHRKAHWDEQAPGWSEVNIKGQNSSAAPAGTGPLWINWFSALDLGRVCPFHGAVQRKWSV